MSIKLISLMYCFSLWSYLPTVLAQNEIDCCKPNVCSWTWSERELLPSAIYSGPYSPLTLEECLRRCLQTPNCHSVDYAASTRTCRLSVYTEVTATTKYSQVVKYYIMDESSCRLISACDGLVVFDSNVHTTLQNYTDHDTILTTCEHCNERVSGDDHVTCYYNGTVIGQPLKCQMITCNTDLLDISSHGVLIPEEASYPCDSMLTISCKEGYYNTTSLSNLVCTDLGWSGVVPSCQQITCDPVITNATSNYTGTQLVWGDVMHFTCGPGLYLYITDTLQCVDMATDGVWKDPQSQLSDVPYCASPPKCPAITSNITLSPSKLAYTMGDMVETSCLNGEVLVGSPSLLACLSTGRDTVAWNDSIPYCVEPKACSTPLTNASWESAEDHLIAGAVVVFSCPKGLSLLGHSELTCSGDIWSVEWSHDFPYCVPVVCRLPPLSPYLQELNNKTEFLPGQYPEFQCESGYRVISPAEDGLYCLHNGTMHGVIPTCELVLCNSTINDDMIINSLSNNNSFSVGFRANLSCLNNKTLEGESSVVMCTNIGQWNVTEDQVCVEQEVNSAFVTTREVRVWWILVGILLALLLSLLISFFCCWLDCCGLLERRRKLSRTFPLDHSDHVIKYTELTQKSHHEGCLCARCVSSTHQSGCLCKACEIGQLISMHQFWSCAHCNICFLHSSKSLLCNCKTCVQSSDHSAENMCNCEYCIESRKHYTEYACDCVSCDSSKTHRQKETRCNCSQCREFRSHSSFRLLQHIQTCQTCQLQYNCDCEVCSKTSQHKVKNSCTCRSCAESSNHHQRLLCACNTCIDTYSHLKRRQFHQVCKCSTCEPAEECDTKKNNLNV